jgi:hypothetical protein
VAVNSREKGKRCERLACAALFELFGWVARRSQQFKGTSDSSDIEVEQTPDAFWEIKHVEKLSVWEAMRVAVSQAGKKLPILMHRRNREPYWLVTIRLDDLMRLSNVVQESTKYPAVASPPLPGDHAGGG